MQVNIFLVCVLLLWIVLLNSIVASNSVPDTKFAFKAFDTSIGHQIHIWFRVQLSVTEIQSPQQEFQFRQRKVQFVQGIVISKNTSTLYDISF